MVGEYTNKRVGRLIAAGSRSLIDDAVRVISRLKAIHMNEYEDDQEGFNLGTPSDNNDSIGNQLSTFRSIVSQTGAKGPSEAVSMDYARGTISQDFTTTVENLVHMFSRIDQIKDEMNNISGEIEVLTKLEPLGIDLDLLVGYSSITSFVGTCLKPSQITDMKLPEGVLTATNNDIVAVFCTPQHQAMMSSLSGVLWISTTGNPLRPRLSVRSDPRRCECSDGVKPGAHFDRD